MVLERTTGYAHEIKIYALRRLGERLVGMKKAGTISEGQPRTVVGARQYLKDLDIDRNLSSRAQRIASVPEEKPDIF